MSRYPIRRPIALLIVLTVCCACLTRQAEAVWIWTPGTHKWTNPKYAVKDTPEEQHQFAQTFLEKFGGDSMEEIRRNYQGYLDSLKTW